MSKRKKQKNKAQTPPAVATPTVTATPKVRSAKSREETVVSGKPLVFGKETYIWLGGGFGLIVLGFLLMAGGRGEDPTVFDESVIYSFTKITLAPILILAGLGVTTFAIFKK